MRILSGFCLAFLSLLHPTGSIEESLQVHLGLSSEVVRPFEPLYAIINVTNGGTSEASVPSRLWDGMAFLIRHESGRSRTLNQPIGTLCVSSKKKIILTPGAVVSHVSLVPKANAEWRTTPGFPEMGRFQITVKISVSGVQYLSNTVEFVVDGNAPSPEVVSAISDAEVVGMLHFGWAAPDTTGLDDTRLSEEGVARLLRVIDLEPESIFADHARLTLGRCIRRRALRLGESEERDARLDEALQYLLAISNTNERLRLLGLLEAGEVLEELPEQLRAKHEPAIAKVEGMKSLATAERALGLEKRIELVLKGLKQR